MEAITSKTFIMHQEGNIPYLTIPSFDQTDLVHHCFSTRLGGVSSGIYSSMNLGFHLGDATENVCKNYQLICGSLGINYKNLVFSHQVHKADIYCVTEEDIGKGITKENDIHGKDGLVTNISNVPLVTLYADCVPLYFLDPVLKVIGLAHAGWRGTVQMIGKEMIKVMHEQYGSKPADILAAIGPSIGPCCFEVDTPVVKEFQEAFGVDPEVIFHDHDDKYMINLWNANEKILLDAGILKTHITKTDICTKCHKDIFFSHRGSFGKRGSLAAIMELK